MTVKTQVLFVCFNCWLLGPFPLPPPLLGYIWPFNFDVVKSKVVSFNVQIDIRPIMSFRVSFPSSVNLTTLGKHSKLWKKLKGKGDRSAPKIKLSYNSKSRLFWYEGGLDFHVFAQMKVWCQKEPGVSSNLQPKA